MSYPSPGMRFEPAGVYRPPRKGEWYRGITGPTLAEQDFFGCRPILLRVDGGDRSAIELAAIERQEQEREEERRRREQLREARPRTEVFVNNRPMKQLAEGYRLPYTDRESDS